MSSNRHCLSTPARIAVAGLLILSSSCHASTATVAKRCALVDLQQKDGRKLIPELREYAEQNHLKVEDSHPVNIILQRWSNAQLQGEIVYTIGMGKFGAVLSVFCYSGDCDPQFLSAYDEFLSSTLSTRYKVTQCADVPGFSTPETYR